MWCRTAGSVPQLWNFTGKISAGSSDGLVNDKTVKQIFKTIRHFCNLGSLPVSWDTGRHVVHPFGAELGG